MMTVDSSIATVLCHLWQKWARKCAKLCAAIVRSHLCLVVGPDSSLRIAGVEQFYHVKVKSVEALMEAHSGTDMQIVRHTWV